MVESAGETGAAPAAPGVAPAAAPALVTKASTVVTLLAREGGATMPELIEATGWLPHTTRAALTGLRKKGHAIVRCTREGTRLAPLFDDPIELIGLTSLDVKAGSIARLHDCCQDLTTRLRKADRETVTALLTQVRVADGRVEIDCSTAGIADLVGLVTHAGVLPNITLVAEALLTRSGMAMKLVQADGAALATKPDATLTRQLITARRWWAELRQGQIDITRLAEREKVTASYVSRIVRLAFLSPAVVEAVVAGKQRHDVDVGKLTQGMPMPACWQEQRQMLLPVQAA